MPVTHPFVSAISNGTNTSLVRPSDWNDQHTVSLTSAAEVPVAVPALVAAAQLNGAF